VTTAVDLRSGLTLAVIAAVCTGMVGVTWQLTHERITANEQAFLEQSLSPALAGLLYDTGVTESKLTIPAPNDLPGPDDAIVYRVYAEDLPVAALFVVSARDGYAGPIKLLVGIGVDGVVSGVRVLAHRETPGLGDRVEASKSDWVLQFNGRSLSSPEPPEWKIRRDGGQFDQLSGASVTPRAIVKAVKETLQYFEANKEAIFAAPADDIGEEPT